MMACAAAVRPLWSPQLLFSCNQVGTVLGTSLRISWQRFVTVLAMISGAQQSSNAPGGHLAKVTLRGIVYSTSRGSAPNPVVCACVGKQGAAASPPS